jgi:hypothetical protein
VSIPQHPCVVNASRAISLVYQSTADAIVSNAFIFPVVYFFYPETAYRSLEEMDAIFHKTTSIFDVVKVAREEPRRFGKNGELLISYDDTEEHAAHARNASVAEPIADETKEPHTGSIHDTPEGGSEKNE